MGDWYKLDNAGKLFPPVANERNTSVYRIAAILTEKVNGMILQKATDHIYKRFPLFFLRMRSGVFWNYMDENKNYFRVEEEKAYPCAEIRPKQNSGYMIKIFYHHKRISLEVFHSLSDGGGAIEFLKSLLYYYFLFKGINIRPEGKILQAGETPASEEMEDSFQRYYEDIPLKGGLSRDSFRIKGTTFHQYGHHIIGGNLSASGLAAAAKARGATVTSYLAALLVYSIIRTSKKPVKKPVVVAVPVSLRRAFPSKSLRNFFCVINLSYPPEQPPVLEAIIAELTAQLREKTQKENLQKVIAVNGMLERNVVSRLTPLFLKRLAIRFGFNFFGEVKKTLTFSNLGRVEIPTDMEPLIQNIEVNLYPTVKSPINCSAISVNDCLSVSFIKTIVEGDAIRFFFSHLATEDGLDVQVYSNNWGA